MREPNSRVEFVKSDFDFSDQVSAEAATTTIFGIDWGRLFTKKTGGIDGGSAASIVNQVLMPIIGNLAMDKTSGYALYELMEANPGYDVIFYPQYETKVVRPFLGLGFIYKKTKVKTTARLGKLN